MLVNNKLGYGLIATALVLIFLLILVSVEYDHQSAVMCELVAEDPDINMTECPAHTSNIPWFITIGFVLLALLLVFGIYVVYTDKKQKGFFVDTSKLDENEKLVVAILKNKEGSCYQSDIVKELEWSKVKTTRVLDKLENKKVIDKKRRGMTNIIILK